MKHLGDITQISGLDAPIVDCVIGGSPCQDLSVAGKRAGLAGERSGLYMDQIRIVKEMRERDRNSGRTGKFIRPRYMVWENVPGAFSSNKGQDFAAVIEEIIKVAESDAVVSVCVPDRGWPKSGCYYAEDCSWSVAWRVHDAQFWGVPQRRKRIALVADFGGLSAPEILFERKGLSRDIEQSTAQREEAAGTAGSGTNGASICCGIDDYNFEPTGDVVCSLRSQASGGACGASVCFGIGSYNSEGIKSANPHSGIYEANTARTLDLNGDNPTCNQGGIAVVVPLPFDTTQITSPKNGNNPNYGDPCHPLAAGMHPPAIVAYAMQSFGDYKDCGIGSSLKARDYKDVSDLVVAAVDCRNGTENSNINGTLQAKSTGGIGVNFQNVCRTGHLVRRLTPLECERLQGFPDGWTDIGEWVDSKGKKHKAADSPRYKALGNSIALPFWKYLIKRLCAQYERDATMASLFDGIGGFPLIWEQINGKGSCLWASEIEEFPIAVTKYHFGE